MRFHVKCTSCLRVQPSPCTATSVTATFSMEMKGAEGKDLIECSNYVPPQQVLPNLPKLVQKQ